MGFLIIVLIVAVAFAGLALARLTALEWLYVVPMTCVSLLAMVVEVAW